MDAVMATKAVCGVWDEDIYGKNESHGEWNSETKMQGRIRR
jgi:hypothetical protein